MSKVSEVKASQGYTEELNTCGKCAFFKFEKVLPAWMAEANANPDRMRFADGAYTVEDHGVEKNLRCDIGKFKVKKMGTCLKFWPKPV